MKVITLTHDFDALVKSFEAKPEATKKMVRQQLKMAARDVREYASSHHNYVTRTGAMERQGIATDVEDTRATISLSESVPYGVYLHEGTKAHDIVPRNKMVLRWATGQGFVFSARARHPGIKADPFLYNAIDAMAPKIISRFEQKLSEILEG